MPAPFGVQAFLFGCTSRLLKGKGPMDKRTKERLATLAKQAAFHGGMWAHGSEHFTREQVDQCALLSMEASTRFHRFLGEPEYEQRWKEAFWSGWQETTQQKGATNATPLE